MLPSEEGLKLLFIYEKKIDNGPALTWGLTVAARLSVGFRKGPSQLTPT